MSYNTYALSARDICIRQLTFLLYIFICVYMCVYVYMYLCILEKVEIYCLLRIAFRTEQPSVSLLAARSITVILFHYESQSACGCQVRLWRVRWVCRVVVHCCCFCYCFLYTCLLNLLSICVAFERHTSAVARSQDRQIPFTRCSCFVLLHAFLLLLLLFCLPIFACNRCKFIFIIWVLLE